MENTHQAHQEVPIETIEDDDFFDVLIIGGGPHALGLAARLREPFPASLYTDLEHSKLSFLRTRRKSQSINLGRSDTDGIHTKILALDSNASEGWLGRWNGFFNHLQIPHLRSPMFFHPGPSDVDGLEAFAKKTGAESACATSNGVENTKPTVGQSEKGGDRKCRRSRALLGRAVNERERASYFRPTTDLFQKFCQIELIKRYNLGEVIKHDTVTGIHYSILHVKTEGRGFGFTVTTSKGKKYGARFVVMSIGPQEFPIVPSCLIPSQSITDSHHGDGWCHSLWFSKGGNNEFKASVKQSSIDGGSIVVIGGGYERARKVILICRGYLKTKHYDFPLSWVTKYSNLEKMNFWQEDCREARLNMVRNARNGGSVNPSTLFQIKRRVAEGRLKVLLHTTVQTATRDKSTGTWSLKLRTESPEASEPVFEQMEDVRFIVASTGGKLNFCKIPFLQPLLQQMRNTELDQPNNSSNQIPPIIQGLPHLTESLQWGEQLPLFVMGGYAALELGPDAGNLSGSRSGAERVGSKLNELLEEEWPLDSNAINPEPNDKALHHSNKVSYVKRALKRQNKIHMGARDRRAGNIGGWFDSLKEIEA
ncbi:Hypothetical protein MELLADRAFT_86675 [Melampsora larici-populina 98AG31]|uniref:L-ornithine N(5)-monooxygenase n=1 Tax=Melampsora larici-populina (strain 98AG31 / pathotype 3-4-7) TaxID=747676 RepID=F4R2Z9_MELLP|nr:Hypothetical protein MELLADRAFT_86675 [Melampsora larici-populina 98AG31]EGG13254.1 Hypothetical protein MELLADRAFT_86675 [Melampsora larici-populina 98AG31]